jgi:uncharacterized membrane protein
MNLGSGEWGAVAAVLMGVSLAACAGLRAFLPVLAAGLAVRMGWWTVPHGMDWMGSTEALIIFGVATVIEVLADKVPFLDHALDTFHTVVRPVAGALVAAGAFSQLSPGYALALGIIVGAPIAGAFHLSKASTRAVSTALTAGTGNPFLSLVEDLIAAAGVFLALVAPVIAALLIGALAFGVIRWLRARRLTRQSFPL